MYCSSCGSLNSDVGRFCIQCGLLLQGSQAPQRQSQPLIGRRRRILKRVGIVFGCLMGLFVLLIVLASVFSDSGSEQSPGTAGQVPSAPPSETATSSMVHPTIAPGPTPIPVTANALQRQQEANQVYWNEHYQDRLVEISGVISSITETGSNYDVKFGTENPLTNVVCKVGSGHKSTVLTLAAGESIKVQGTVSDDGLFDIVVKNCSIVRAEHTASKESGSFVEATASSSATSFSTPTTFYSPVATPTSLATLPMPSVEANKPLPTQPQTSTLAPEALLVYGPEGGYIPFDGNVGSVEFGKARGDLVVEVTFRNDGFHPGDDVAPVNWHYGICFLNSCVRLVNPPPFIGGAGWHYTGQGGFQASGSASIIDFSPAGKNTLQIVVIGLDGWLYINGEFQQSLEFVPTLKASSLELFAEDLDYYHDAGGIRFEDLTVRRWEPTLAAEFEEVDSASQTDAASVDILYGPESGAIQHNPDNETIEYHIGPTFQGNVEIGILFHNPFPEAAPRAGSWLYTCRERPRWHYALILESLPRYTDVNPQTMMPAQFSGNLRFTVDTAYGLQYIYSRNDPPGGVVSASLELGVKESAIDWSVGEANRLKVILVDEKVFLYANDTFQHVVRLESSRWDSDFPHVRRVSLTVEDHCYVENAKRSAVTRFDDFTVSKWNAREFEYFAQN